MRSEDWIDETLQQLSAEGLERRLEVYPPAGQPTVNFSSNDYLCLSSHPQVVAAMHQATLAGSGASRLVSGTQAIHEGFERQLARFLCKPAAVVFGAGYLANLGVLSTWLRRSDTVFADRLVHASLIDGIQLSMARHVRFRHNQAEHLEQLLSKESATRPAGSRWLVVVESVYSMDGDRAPLKEIANLAETYDAQLMVDEAHALGVFGPAGRGVTAELDMIERVGLITGTLSKSFGSYGGFVACSEPIRRLIINRARPFIYNTALPPGVMNAASVSLAWMENHAELGTELLSMANHFRNELCEQGCRVGDSTSQIVPVIVGENHHAMQLAEKLQNTGIYVRAIRPPTVPMGTARLRFSLTLAHDKRMLSETAKLVGKFSRELGIVR